MRVRDQDVEDYFNIVNALNEGPSIPANVSFDIHWRHTKQRVNLDDKINRFKGTYLEDSATIAWSASENGFSFVSDPSSTSTTVFAEIGKERNGAFF